MNPTLRKFMSLADEANLGKGTLAAQEKFLRLVQAEPQIPALDKVTRGLDPVNRITPGSLITFSYRAKGANDLPYWDRYPLVLVTQINKDGWTGINLHYMHPRLRARALYERNRFGIPIIEQEIANLCVKRYLAKFVMSRPREFPSELHDIAIQLPFDNFQKEANVTVWNKTSRKRKR